MNNRREQMGKVKLRVRESALRMRDFTLEQMIKATGCNRDSVQSELRRMREEGLLTVGKCTTETPQRGAPVRLYSLSDADTRLELASQIEDFFSKPQRQEQPTSQHYFHALKLLDEVEANKVDTRTQSSLEQAKEELEFAWHEEGEPENGIDGHIKTQLGRLEYLQGNYDQAEKLFRQAKQIFENNGLREQEKYVREYLLTLSVHLQLAGKSEEAKDENSSSLVNETQTTVGVLRTVSLSNNPLSVLLLNLVERLLMALRDSIRDLVLAEARAQLSRQMHQMADLLGAERSSIPEQPFSGTHSLFTLELPGSAQMAAAPAWSIGKQGWTHNPIDDYNYAFRSEPKSIEYLAVNSSLRRTGSVSTLMTAVQNEEWLASRK